MFRTSNVRNQAGRLAQAPHLGRNLASKPPKSRFRKRFGMVEPQKTPESGVFDPEIEDFGPIRLQNPAA
jgi:hypothetical protein